MGAQQTLDVAAEVVPFATWDAYPKGPMLLFGFQWDGVMKGQLLQNGKNERFFAEIQVL